MDDEGVVDSLPVLPVQDSAALTGQAEELNRAAESVTLDGGADPEANKADPDPEADSEAEAEPQSLARRAIPWIVLVVIAAVAAVLLRTFAFQTFYVPSSSMEPTLLPGDRMLVLKFDLGTIHRGEVIVFKRPPGDTEDFNDEDLVKRVIGLPGQTIYSVGSKIYINGQVISQPWLPKGAQPGPPIPKLTIPKNDYFVMGDNRVYSYDSRYWNPHYVPRSNIIGQVLFVIWRNGHPFFKAF